MPRTSKIKDGWGSDTFEKSCEQSLQQVDLPNFDVFFDSLSLQYETKRGSESTEPIVRGPKHLALDLPLFHDYFGCLQFNSGRKTSNQDEWESILQEPLNNRQLCLKQTVLCDFTRYCNPILAWRKILQVVEWVKPKGLKSIPSMTDRQALLAISRSDHWYRSIINIISVFFAKVILLSYCD
jgi:hypothetical protein